jgi:DNA-binding transcriptional regulator PaaX
VLEERTLSLRAFDEAGMLREGLLVSPGDVEKRIEALLGDPEVASIHAHTPANGCFLARIERN